MSDMNEKSNVQQENGMDELEAMFGADFSNMEKIEQVALTQSLEGFASCFPEWDLHPPVNR